MDATTRQLLDDAYQEAVGEAVDRGLSKLTAHKEGVVAAAMMLSAMTGLEDGPAHAAVVGLNLRPAKSDE